MTIKDNRFISKEASIRSSDIADGEDISDKFHYVNFKIPIFFKRYIRIFKKIDLLKYTEFNINVSFIDKIVISKRANIKTSIKSCFFMLKK